MQPYHLKRDQGSTYNIGIDVTLKAGEYRTTNGAAVFEFMTRRGEEPGEHTHENEDEMFYVLDGEISFLCAGKTFAAGPGDFVFLPHGLPHNYDIGSEGAVRLLVITAPPRRPSDGWGGFVGDFERSGQPED